MRCVSKTSIEYMIVILFDKFLLNNESNFHY